MKVNIFAVNFELAEHLNQFVDKKTKRYERLLAPQAEMEVRFSVIKPASKLNKQTAIRVMGDGAELFVEKTCDTFEQGLDLCLEAIDKQLERRKEH